MRSEPRLNGTVASICSQLSQSERVVIGRHKTSVSLEDAFWSSLTDIAASRQTTKSGLLTEINERREAANLSSAVRLFVLQHYQDRARS